MKKLLLTACLLTTAFNSYGLQIKSSTAVTTKDEKIIKKCIVALYNDLVHSRYTAGDKARALHDLSQVCVDPECMVEHSKSKEILEKHGLVSNKGIVKKGVCELLPIVAENLYVKH